jgi:hypothetical protein
MKLQAVIGGDKIDDMEFRFFFLYKAVELGCERFSSFIRNSEGLRGLVVRIEGNEDQVAGFKNFVEDQVHECMQISSIIFEEYTGHVYTIEAFLAFCTAELLDKWDREYRSAEKLKSNSNDVII